MGTIITFLFAVALFGMPFFMMYKLSRPVADLDKDAVKDQIGILYEDLNIDKKRKSKASVFVTHYFVIFIFRRMFFILLLVFVADQPGP